jgi:hypothetical protein
MKAHSLIEARVVSRFEPVANRNAIGLPSNIERMSTNPAAEPQPTVVGVSDYILNHPI